jgi:hypothetical protein
MYEHCLLLLPLLVLLLRVCVSATTARIATAAAAAADLGNTARQLINGQVLLADLTLSLHLLVHLAHSPACTVCISSAPVS